MPFPPESKPRDHMRWLALRVLARDTKAIQEWLAQTGQSLDFSEMECQAAEDVLDLLDWLEKQERKRIEAGGFVRAQSHEGYW